MVTALEALWKDEADTTEPETQDFIMSDVPVEVFIHNYRTSELHSFQRF